MINTPGVLHTVISIVKHTFWIVVTSPFNTDNFIWKYECLHLTRSSPNIYNFPMSLYILTSVLSFPFFLMVTKIFSQTVNAWDQYLLLLKSTILGTIPIPWFVLCKLKVVKSFAISNCFDVRRITRQLTIIVIRRSQTPPPSPLPSILDLRFHLEYFTKKNCAFLLHGYP